MNSGSLQTWALALWCGVFAAANARGAAGQQAVFEGVAQLSLPVKTGEVFMVDNFDFKVTRNDMGFNFFSGNMGEVNNPAAGAGQRPITTNAWSALSAGTYGGSWLLAFDFTGYPNESFCGGFLSLFGLTDTLVELKGTGTQPSGTTKFNNYYLNFDNLYGAFAPWHGRSVDGVAFETRLIDGSAGVIMKVELQDEFGNDVFVRVSNQAATWGTAWLTRSLFSRSTRGKPATFRWDRVSLMSFIVERRHVADGVNNPATGGFLVDNIRLVDADGLYPNLLAARDTSTGALRPEYRDAFLDHVRKLSFLYFLDFASTDPRTGGMIQDRGTFADLMSVGGAGFQLTAYVIGAQRGYLSRAEAAARVAALLTVLNAQPQGAQRVGAAGYRGFFYHFFGIDGLRKQQFACSATAGQDESLNTVELSAIDTSLALMGVITAKQYFRGADAVETGLRAMAESIVRRVEWPFMKATLSNGAQQVCLGWKPDEPRDPAQGRFLLPDGTGRGFFSSKPGAGGTEVAATLDYYTDEGQITALLGMAAPDEAKRLPRAVWDDIIRTGDGFVKTYPGSLFTYQFLSCWVDTQAIGTDNHTERPVDFFENTRQAIAATRQYATTNAVHNPGVGPTAWGFSACEGPYDTYAAEAAPNVALDVAPPPDTGTLTVYGAGCSILHLPDEAVAALWRAASLDLNGDGRPDLLHPRFGFADAFNSDIASVRAAAGQGAFKQAGGWANMTGFAIDQGPLLIMLDNALGGQFVPRLFMSDTNIHRVLRETFPGTPDIPAGTAPAVTARSPLRNPVFMQPKGKAHFTLSATDGTDPDTAGRGMVSVTWSVDGVEQLATSEGAPGAIASDFTFTAGASLGSQTVKAVALDRQGERTEIVWDVWVTDRFPPEIDGTSGTAFEFPLPGSFAAAEKVTVSGLPPGLKYNAATHMITGVPTKAGTYTVVISATGLAAQLVAFKIEALPAWAQGAFNGYVEGGGTATMTVSALGKVTGKVVMAGTNYAFSAASYAADGSAAAGFSVAAAAKAGKAALPLEVRVTQAGAPQALAIATGRIGGSVPVAMWRDAWKDAAGTLAPLIGYYTATLPGNDEYGSGYLTFTVDKAGKVKVGGRLADGTAASLSGTLILDGEGGVFAVVYAAPAAYKGGCLFGLAEFVRPDAGLTYLRPLDGEPFLWQSRGPQATEAYGAGFDRAPGLVGGWYGKTADLGAYYAGKSLSAGADPDAPAPELAVGAVRYDSVWWGPAGVALTPTGKPGAMAGLAAPAAGKPTDVDKNGVWDYGATNSVGMKCTLTRATGVFKGSLLAWFDYPVNKHVSKSIAYEGVLTSEREDKKDGVEGRGYFLWPDKAVPPLPARPYSFNWSYDFLLLGE